MGKSLTELLKISKLESKQETASIASDTQMVTWSIWFERKYWNAQSPRTIPKHQVNTKPRPMQQIKAMLLTAPPQKKPKSPLKVLPGRLQKRHLPKPLKTLRRSLQRHLPKNLQLHLQLQKVAQSLLRRLSLRRNPLEDERCFSINAFLGRWSHCFANVLDSKMQ